MLKLEKICHNVSTEAIFTSVMLDLDGEQIDGVSFGDDSLASIRLAIKDAISGRNILPDGVEMKIRGWQKNGTAEVEAEIRSTNLITGKRMSGHDIVIVSAKALLFAINEFKARI